MAVTKKNLISIRDYQSDDQNFILSTWLNGLRYGNDWFKEIDQETYFKAYHPIVCNLIFDSKVSVACLKEDPSVILAYSVHDGDVLHYVFCKEVWRGIGLSKDLIPQNLKVVTHLTKTGLSILKKKYPNAIFNPFWSKNDRQRSGN